MVRAARSAVGLAALLLAVTVAGAEPATLVIDHGDPANRLDIAVLGDGYTAAQLDQYAAEVADFMQSALGEPPYDEYASYVNVHRVDVVSSQSGADHPEDVPASWADTALDASYGCAGIERLICVNTAKVNAVLQASLPADARDIVIVLVNDPEYGGSGGSLAVASTHWAAVSLVLHETGHSFGLLADEYWPGPCAGAIEPPEPNATRETQQALIKWGAWLEASTQLPTAGTAPGQPGLYAGSKYCESGLYRPTYSSLMRNLARPFEQVNSEQLVRRIYNWVSPIDGASPVDPLVPLEVGESQLFQVTPLAPTGHALDVDWRLDGEPIASGTSEFALLATAPGQATLEASVSDPTPLVRSDPNAALEETRSWTISVPEPGALLQLTAGGALLTALRARRRAG